ncbi:aminopeptidase P family protein [Anaplasma bovis]|uniref:aminopeptidase P family protein n=1 Tax=Anaplasma bovis TaxID=186733 RepID=UPI002FEEEA03
MDSKLVMLWDLMKEWGVDVFLLQHTDEYQSQDIHASKRRIEWLCGFSGSNAFIVVCPGEKGKFFTDSRYIVQSAVEVNQEYYQIYDMCKVSPVEWIKNNTAKDAIVGYDGELFTLKQIRPYDGLRLKMLTGIALDMLWKREISIVQRIVSHPVEFAGVSNQEKRQEVVKKISGADAVLMTDVDAISWLLNIRNLNFLHNPSVLSRAILYKDGAVDLFVDDVEQVSICDKDIKVLNSAALPSTLAAIDNIAVDAATVPMSIFFAINDRISVVMESDLCTIPKSVKNITEIKGAESAHIRDGVALVNFLHWLESKIANEEVVTEIDAEIALLEFRKQQELFMGESFGSISAFGENAAIVHYRATDSTNTVLKKGGIYLIDSGGQYLDGTTDVTRTIAIGAPTDEQIRNYTAVLKGHIALARAVFPRGTRGSALDTLARQHLWRMHLQYGHSTGHGVGSFLSVHEGPQAISAGNNVAILPGMIFSNEPGYYKEGEYGIRIENLMYAEECGDEFLRFKQLTCVPMDKRLMDITALDAVEVEYINGYHGLVRDALGPRVSGEVRKWLYAACEDI